ncbi:MAG: carboxypeptidase regulatory-like domain-containing protein, partial [Acidobacteria bacterium]|nr:carboxypeptidase regulatory-like domain-containing protein [Acidobacteriota bacterium]
MFTIHSWHGRSVFLFMAAFFLLQDLTSAQGLTGITGRVTDPSGAVIPGVEVTATNNATGAVRTAISNEGGIYTLTQLQPGTYNIRAELSGFKAKIVNNVPLPVNETVTLNLPLEVGEVSDVVDVVANVEAVSTVDAKLGVGFDEKKIIDLPLNARNIVGLLALQTGVNVSEKTGEFGRDDGGQVNGARNDQQNIVLDGVNINAQERGSSLEGALPTTLDSVQEFIVQTAGGGGAAQRGSGAQVQLVTKSGGNEWHGSAYEFYRTTGTSARNFFAKEATPLIRHLPGGSLGGPLMKDKLFIFGAYEHHTDRSATLVTRDVPTPEFLNGIVRYRRRDGTFGVLTDGPNGALERFTQITGDRWNPNVIGPNGIYEAFRPFSTDASRTEPGADRGANTLRYRFNAPFKRDRNIYISRLDYNLNAGNTLFFRGTLNDDVRTLGAETFPGLNNARERLDNSKGFAANWNWVISPTLNSNLTAGLTRESFEDTGNNQPFYNIPLFSEFIQTAGAERQAIDTWNIAENLSWLKGNHNVQAGGNFRYIDNFLRSFDAVQAGTFSAAANLTANNIGTSSSPGLRRALGDEEFARIADPGIVGDAVLAATGSVTQFSEDVQYDINGRRLAAGVPFERKFRLQEYDVYLQDTWRMRPDFTLTFGVNYSVQTPPYEANGLQVNWVENLGQRLKVQSDTPKNVTQLPLYAVQPGGRANGLPDYYAADTNNWAPRASFAWSPKSQDGFFGGLMKGGQLVVRGGYQLSYDRVGGRFARDAALLGSVGLKTRFGTPGFSRSFDGLNRPRAQRLGAGGALPRADFPVAPDTPDFSLPVSAGGAGGVSTTGIDSGIHSPTNHLVNLTVSKELPGGWVVEASYVGRFARDLVGQVDIASPVNIRDPLSGMTYYDAVKQLYERFEFNSTPVAGVQPIAWFENVYPEIKAHAERQLNSTFSSATQAFYALLHKSVAPGPNSQTSLVDEFNELESSLG